MCLTVRRVMEVLATHPDRQRFGQKCLELKDEDIRQVLAHVAANVVDQVLELRGA